MSEEGSVLPQAEIDALFRQATGMAIVHPSPPVRTEADAAPAPASPVAARQVKFRQPPAAVSKPITPLEPEASLASSDIIAEMQATLNDLVRRIGRMEANIEKLNDKTEQHNDLGGSLETVTQSMAVLRRDLQRINGRVNGVLNSLNDSPTLSLQKEFACGSCGSHGLVALMLKCTNCGEEGWWGLWPEKEE